MHNIIQYKHCKNRINSSRLIVAARVIPAVLDGKKIKSEIYPSLGGDIWSSQTNIGLHFCKCIISLKIVALKEYVASNSKIKYIKN